MATRGNAVQGVCQTCPVRRRMHTCCLPSCKCKTSLIPTGHYPEPPSLPGPSSPQAALLDCQSCMSNCTLVLSTILAAALSAAHLSFVLVMPPSTACVHLVGTVLQFALAGSQGGSIRLHIQLHIASYSFIHQTVFGAIC